MKIDILKHCGERTSANGNVQMQNGCVNNIA